MGTSGLIPRIIRKARTGEYLGEWKGRATAEALEQWRQRFNASLMPGGVNAHLGQKAWILCNLEVYDQRTRQVVARHQAPMFEVVP